MENNEEQIVDINKKPEEKPTPFLKRVNELEKRVERIEIKLNSILSVLKARR